MGDKTKEEEIEHETFMIFGKDVSRMPCFRSSFLYGITSGIFVGLGTFMWTSRFQYSGNVGIGAGAAATCLFWVSCTWKYTVDMVEARLLSAAIAEARMAAGTEKAMKTDRDPD